MYFVFFINDKCFNFLGFKMSSFNVIFINKEVLSGIIYIYVIFNILY